MFILTEKPVNWERISKVVRCQPKLFPPLFKNWPSFRKYGVTRPVIQALRETFESKRGQISIREWLLPRCKKYIPRIHVLTEADVEYFEVFQPSYLKKIGKIKKLSEEEERELEKQIIEDETELKRLLVPKFLQVLFLSGRYDSKAEKLFRAFNSSQELCVFLEKVLEFYKLSYSAPLPRIEALEKACRQKDENVLKSLTASDYQKMFDALTEVQKAIQKGTDI